MAKPDILSRKICCQSRLFAIEQHDLKFSNGNLAQYEKIKTRTGLAVALVPMLDAETVLLVREYAGGMEDYQISLAKGAIEPGEGALIAANRELQEEIGYGAHKLEVIKTMGLSPGNLDVKMHIVLAQDLYESRLEGDEPEPLEVIPWKLSNLEALFSRNDCYDACTIAALLWMKNHYGL